MCISNFDKCGEKVNVYVFYIIVELMKVNCYR